MKGIIQKPNEWILLKKHNNLIFWMKASMTRIDKQNMWGKWSN